MKLCCGSCVATQLQRFPTVTVAGTLVGYQLRERHRSAEPICFSQEEFSLSYVTVSGTFQPHGQLAPCIFISGSTC